MTSLLATRTVRTVPLPEPGRLVDLLPATRSLAWIREGQGLVGWGEVARVELAGPTRFADAQHWWRTLTEGAQIHDEVRLPGSGPVAFGSFSFDERTPSVLVVPEVVVGVRDGRWWLTSWGELPEVGPTGPAAAPTGVRLGPDDGQRYVRRVAEAVRRIGRGELAKVVLARSVPARLGAPLDVRAPLRALAAGYPGCWTYHVEGLFGATPELLVRLTAGVAASRVLAGTLRRPVDDSHDAAQAALLARSRKDLEEHEYAVRSVRDALAPHAAGIEVTGPFVLHLPNVLHLATDVTAAVTGGVTALDLVAALHPSAAVCGTPTEVALEVVRELEGLQRGRYAGPVGWVDARGEGEWGLALRCAQLDAGDRSVLRLYAGCGVVAGSVPADELAESEAKLLPVRQALGDPTP